MQKDVTSVWNQEETVSGEKGQAEDQTSVNTDGDKVAYLTFDDGPSKLTQEYLAVLRKEQVTATFFLIGQQIDGDLIPVVKQAKEEGHEIGVHTYSHNASVIYASQESYIDDLLKTRDCIQEKCQITPQLFRFPWGSANAYVQGFRDGVIEAMKKEGMEYADWNVSGEDSVGCPTPETIAANVRKDFKKYDNPVILLHDSATCDATLQALPEIIEEIKQEGYCFATLSRRQETCHFGEY
ncbi:MAG: polysaccharide deacetylase [Clostridiaceae bacterium]|nr:polysaccharide deacetylase [Clostridiaceae bacterium]